MLALSDSEILSTGLGRESLKILRAFLKYLKYMGVATKMMLINTNIKIGTPNPTAKKH